MIVTINDYRDTAEPEAGYSKQQPPNDADLKFTVAGAGHLKLKLQALNNALIRTPLDQHSQLQFDDILQSDSPRTYVNGSEEVYFLLKSLLWPNKIPEIFIKAYSEVLQFRPFTNAYICRTFTEPAPGNKLSVSARFAPTFSKVRPLLPQLDVICNTKLNDFFEEANKKVNPFAFMRLPTELRLQVYDYLVPPQPFIRLYPNKIPKPGSILPEGLEIMRVCKTIYKETSKQFFNKPTLLIEACRESRHSSANGCFNGANAADYAACIENMTADIRHNITRLEIRILSDSAGSGNSHLLDRLKISPMRQIFAALPNLDTLLFSYPAIPGNMLKFHHMSRQSAGRSFYDSRKCTLDWIRAQLHEGARLRILWDLTYFRYSVEDAKHLREEIMAERMMKELVERDGGLELATSAMATRKDLEIWSEIRKVVLQAVEQR